jgi:hypothetical protein
MEVYYETSKDLKDVDISQLMPCCMAGREELKLDS